MKEAEKAGGEDVRCKGEGWRVKVGLSFAKLGW